MGIMTVTGMSSIVAGLNASMAAQIEALRLVGGLHPALRPRARTCRRGAPPPQGADRRRGGGHRRALPAGEGDLAAGAGARSSIIKYGNADGAGRARCSAPRQAYETVHDIFVERGRFLNEADVDRGSQVVVHRAATSRTRCSRSSIRSTRRSRIDGRRFRVIGVTGAQGQVPLPQPRQLRAGPPGLACQKQDPRFNFMVADIKPVSPAQHRRRGRRRCARRAAPPAQAASSRPRTTSRSSPRTRSPTSTASSRAASTW